MLNLFRKKPKSKFNPKSSVNSIGRDLNKLVDGNLPFGWIAYHKNIVKPKDDKMVSLALKTKTQDLNEKIIALKNLIQYFYSYKEECKSMGECFEKYFDDMWMHCHNSRSNDFVYITPYEEELKLLEK